MKHPEINRFITRQLRIVSYLWISFPIGYLLYCNLILQVPFNEILKILLSPGYWFVALAAAIAGFGMIHIYWYGWYLFVFSNFTISYFTAVTLLYSSAGKQKFLLFALTLLVQILFMRIAGSQIRVPYFFPRIRWWESDPRYKLEIATEINREGSNKLEGVVMDISQGGCFIKTHAYYQFGETVDLVFSIFERSLKCQGQVVWKTESRVTHPKGIGVKFQNLDKETVFCLRQATMKLKKLTRIYTEMSKEKNWQEYLQREQNFQGKKN